MPEGKGRGRGRRKSGRRYGEVEESERGENEGEQWRGLAGGREGDYPESRRGRKEVGKEKH